MYNRYIPNGSSYARVVEEDAPPFRPPEERPAAPPAGFVPVAEEAVPRSEAAPEPVPAAEEKKKAGLAGLLKGLKLDSLDTGDILLLLILLFLFLEGDDMELIITLGLLLLLGLD